MSNKGNLFLIPTIIAAGSHDGVISPGVRQQQTGLRYFLAENIRTARRYLSTLSIYDNIEMLSFSVLAKNTGEDELAALFSPVFDGSDVGVLSESGCPGIADPGAIAVRFAHRHEINVIPLVGPSSILLALMASGLNGQRFAFQGYLPVRSDQTTKAIRDFEKESRTKGQTQIFIETPYRNNTLLTNLLKTLSPDTDLCLAVDLTGESEFIFTQSVSDWRRNPPLLPKCPAVFLFLA